MSQSKVYYLYRRIQEGLKDVEDNARVLERHSPMKISNYKLNCAKY